MKIVRITILCAAVSLALPCVAKAYLLGTADIVHSGYGANDVVKIWGGDYSGDNVYGGLYMLDKTDGTGQGNIWPDGPVSSFCVELHEQAPDSTLKYGVVMPEDAYNSFLGSTLGTTKADYLRELWGRFFDPLWVSGPYDSKQNGNAEAFAAAVWEIVYEDLPTSPLGWDVSVDGTPSERGFRAEDVDVTTANKYLHALTGYGPKADLRAFVYQGKQDFLVEVPEPATIALFGIGGVLSLLRRRRTSM
ncbi:MAG: PEP-CTERM sorting domain-containing protein [Sedimentisphaerales bacterium]